MVKDILLEFMVRTMFNTMLLMGLMFPIFDIDAKLGITVGIVIILDLANRIFTKVWSS